MYFSHSIDSFKVRKVWEVRHHLIIVKQEASIPDPTKNLCDLFPLLFLASRRTFYNIQSREDVVKRILQVEIEYSHQSSEEKFSAVN